LSFRRAIYNFEQPSAKQVLKQTARMNFRSDLERLHDPDRSLFPNPFSHDALPLSPSNS